MSVHNAYRDGKVHVCFDKCPTCIFRPGNLMKLAPGRLSGMISEATENESAIICHSTLYRPDIDNAVCHGFFTCYATAPLQIAARMGLIEWDEVAL